MVQLRDSTVIGIFEDQEHARHAFRALKEAGFAANQIKLVAADRVPGAQEMPVRMQRRAVGGAVAGTLAGAAIGGVACAIGASLALGDIWGIGSNPFFSFATGAIFGAVAGAFVSPFLAMALSQKPRQPADQTVVMVENSDRLEDARTLLSKHGAYDRSMKGDPEVPLSPNAPSA